MKIVVTVLQAGLFILLCLSRGEMQDVIVASALITFIYGVIRRKMYEWDDAGGGVRVFTGLFFSLPCALLVALLAITGLGDNLITLPTFKSQYCGGFILSMWIAAIIQYSSGGGGGGGDHDDWDLDSTGSIDELITSWDTKDM